MKKNSVLHKKIITDEEIEIVKMINDLSLTSITLLQHIDGNILYEKRGIHQDRLQWDIIKLYVDVLEPLHSIKTDKFTPGIYSFMRSDSDSNNTNYLEYIVEELSYLINIKIDFRLSL